MNKIIIMWILLMSLFLSSCSKWVQNDNVAQINVKLKTIYTSFYPIFYITKELVWDSVNVVNLVPEWWEPHDYDPNLKTIEELSKWDLVILNGLWLERYEEKLVNTLKNTKILIASENLVNLISLNNNLKKSDWHNHWNVDPHTWLSPKTYIEITNVIIKELEKHWYNNLNKTILTSLGNLDKKFETELSICKRKEFITSHEAFAYLARDYNLKQNAIFGISPEEEPKAKDIANVIELIKKDKIPVIYSEKFISKKFIDTVQKETNTKVLELHPLETLESEELKNGENYITIMTKNLEALKQWLDCKL